MRRLHRSAPFLGALLLTLNVIAQDGAPPPEAAPAPPATGVDAPPMPPGYPGGDDAAAFDWIQLNNGEWLKGDIDEIQDGEVQFDSDELDDLTLDLDDIHAIYSNRPNTVMLRDRTRFAGTLRIEGELVSVMTDQGKKQFTRRQMRTVIPGEYLDRGEWSGKLSLGATIRRGNVDQTDLSLYFRVQRRTVLSRFVVEYSGSYSQVGDERTANNHRLTAIYDVYLTPRFYVRPIGFEYYRDEFQNIDYRLTPSVGAGYDIIDESKLEWRAGGGVGWQFTKFVDPVPGQPEDDKTVALLANTHLEWEVNDNVDLTYDFSVSVPVPKTEDYNFTMSLGTEVELWSDFDLDVRIVWDRTNNPAPSGDGSTPDPDDLRLIVGIGFSW